MAFTNSWTETEPVDSDNCTSIDDWFRRISTAVRERLALDHNVFADEADETVEEIGAHKQVRLLDKVTTPSNPASGILIYNKAGVPFMLPAITGDPTCLLANKIAVVEEQALTTVGGGGASAATWNGRIFHSITVNSLAEVTLTAGGHIQIEPGLYIIEIHAPACGVGAHRIKLYNTVSNADIFVGQNAHAPKADLSTGYAYTQSQASLFYELTVTATTLVAVKHYTQNAIATFGLGYPCSDGSTEKYMVAKIIKVG